MFPSFTNFDEFLAGFGEFLSTEFFNDTYPDYYEESTLMEDVNGKYICHFLATGLDAQEGLTKILDCFFQNPRYANEGDIIHTCIQPFINAGASLFPLTSKIITIPSDEIPSDERNLEEWSTSIEVRSRILDLFWNCLDLDYIHTIANWISVKPEHWWDIPESEQSFMAFCKYYKFCSNYLRGEHLL